jgi:hypothetical protein
MTDQTTAAAERSAHVERGTAPAASTCPVVEIAPGVWQLRRVAELEARRSDLTIGEAAAWEAARDACEREAREIAARMRESVANDEPDEDGLPQPCTLAVRQSAAAADLIADAIARLQPPRAIETGLHGRGA